MYFICYSACTFTHVATCHSLFWSSFSYCVSFRALGYDAVRLDSSCGYSRLTLKRYGTSSQLRRWSSVLPLPTGWQQLNIWEIQTFIRADEASEDAAVRSFPSLLIFFPLFASVMIPHDLSGKGQLFESHSNKTVQCLLLTITELLPKVQLDIHSDLKGASETHFNWYFKMWFNPGTSLSFFNDGL